MKKRNKETIGLILALILCFMGAFGEMVFQTNFGNTKVEELQIVTESGYELAMNLYRPANATAETPAPAIVLEHGGNDDKLLMTRYAIEMARRGYVAVTVDMYSHGNSELLPDSQWLTAGRGLYDAIRHIVTWPFVDSEEINVMGYSRGGKACGEMMNLDNETLHVIKNIYLLFSDPIYRTEDGEYTDVYGARNVRVLADLYDEFFFTEKADSGTYNNDTNRFMQTLTSPVDYINNNSAQSFLYFGEDPEGKELREASVVYTKDYDGVTASREIGIINQDHMAGHYSATVLNDILDFFARVEPSPIGINEGAALFWGYDISAFIGMLGLIMFLVYATELAISHFGYFKEVGGKIPSIISVNKKSDKVGLWIGVLLGVIFNIIVVWGINMLKFSSWHDSIFRSTAFVYTPMLCLLGGILVLIVTTVSFKLRWARKEVYDKERLERVLPGAKVVLKSFLLAVIIMFGFYLLVSAGKYFFGINYKFTIWSFQVLSTERLKFAVLVMPMTILFYVATAISNEGFGYSSILGRNRVVNAVATAVSTALPIGIIMIYFYTYFRVTGWNPMFGGNAAAGNSLYKLPMILFVMSLISRAIYEKTGNVYLGGFITGILTAIMTASVCEIRIPEVDEPFTVSFTMLALLIVAYAVFIICLSYFNKMKKSEKE